MAVVIHRSGKNMNYGDVLSYYSYKHKEDSRTKLYEPILDENGLLQERDHYAVTYITAMGTEDDPSKWSSNCVFTNMVHKKNQKYRDCKSHEYIISHPASDRQRLSMEDLLEEGKAFARDNLKGYDALIAVHRDTDNDHVHISINSVRRVAREEEPWMIRNENGDVYPCEMKAGGKHQESATFREHYHNWLRDYTKSHELEVRDNYAIHHERKERRKMSKLRELKEAVSAEASEATSFYDLKERLRNKYGITMTMRGKTISFRHPKSQKAVRISTLGLSLDHLLTSNMDLENSEEHNSPFDEAQKKYIQWLNERRFKNTVKAENALQSCQRIIDKECRSKGVAYHKSDFLELNDMLCRSVYLDRDLETEAQKLQKFIAYWDRYNDPSASPKERVDAKRYLIWAGCNPDSPQELDVLSAGLETIRLQQQQIRLLRAAMLKTAAEWKGKNDLYWAERELQYSLQREDYLKAQLKVIQANREKLSTIAYNCQRAANRRFYKSEYLSKAEHFRKLWHEKLQEEKRLKNELKELQRKKAGLPSR